MRWSLAVGLCLLAGSAAAATLSPVDQKFHMLGFVSVSAPQLGLTCNVRIEGRVDANGLARVSYANIKSANGCMKVSFSGLPWKFSATGTGTGKIGKVIIDGPLTACGPRTVPVEISGAGEISFNNVTMPGKCSISGSLQSTPAISTVQ